MAYTGDVTVGGPPDTRELPGLTVAKLAVGPMDNNAYLLTCTQTGEAVLIDAANEADRLLELIEQQAGAPDHHHAPALRSLAGTQRGAGGHRRGGARPPRGCARAVPVKVTAVIPQPPDSVPVGAARLAVIHLRGHTPGSVALSYDAGGQLADSPHLFTGDSVFPGGPGNTQGDARRFGQLMDDLEERVFAPLPDATWVYPGHGGDTTLGAERPHLSEWRARGW